MDNPQNMGVLQTGQYLLRYTVYNKNNSVLMAKCFGQRFTISTVNRFPGLQPPTPLTQVRYSSCKQVKLINCAKVACHTESLGSQ
jgi:hypothetical protein